jgi:hypothetical protein
MIIEEHIDITTWCVVRVRLEVDVDLTIEKQVPRESTTDPSSHSQGGFNRGDARENMIEISCGRSCESFLVGVDVVPHGHFRPRRAVMMRPKIARTKVKSQKLRQRLAMIRSLCY